MADDLEGRVIKGVDMSNTAFINTWKDLPSSVKAEAKDTIKSLLMMSLDQVPRKLHMHQLVNKEVPSIVDEKKKVRAWSLHITADDRYKASFTFEGGVMYFRVCGLHDTIDKKP